MALVELRLVSATTAERLRKATAGSDNVIDPRRVEAGSWEGWWAFSANAMIDPALSDAVEGITTRRVTLDTELAWPETAE